ncbi:MAG: hypothetical protein ACD_22C00135G0009 [uncultured bacterium]|nr:MAG: hypothetical protein ACD_22C00135G0009 [uncultured bacterium]
MNEPILETVNISKSYKVGDSEILAVKGVSIKIAKGEFVSIVGKSGSGKSTLMHIIGLLDTPTSGQIILNGVNTHQFNEKKLAQIRNIEIGFVFQAFNLLQRTTALDNVILPLVYSKVPKSQWKTKATEMLNLVGLGDRLKNKSNELSGGQKQRVAIARALITNPSIILADEPTGNLDSKTGDEIISIFNKLNSQGITIILVTHDDDVAKVAQRKIVLKDGEVV